MKRLVGVLGSIGIVTLVALTLVHDGDAGKTIKLPHYDITFGKWPLMEVTKKRSVFRPSGGPKGGRGGKNYKGPRGPGSSGPYAPSSYATSGPNSFSGPYASSGSNSPSGSYVPYSPSGPYVPQGPMSGGYRLGPPPTPSKLLLVNPSENKGVLHHHLQETLKHYAASKAPKNLNLPIIVRAPGPLAPPPPPGYKLGPNLGIPDSSWKPGSPYTVNDVTSQYEPPRSSRLSSMLKNAAYSGMFKNSVDSYTSPELSYGPPMSGTFITVNPDGTEVRTHVNEAFLPGPPRLASEAEEVKPSIPPVLKIGGPPPDNYTIVYAERQLIGVKSPDTWGKSGISNPEASEYEADINLGTKYEQGYGPKPPPTHPLVITKFQKRGDVHHIPEKLIEQDLPDTGLLSTTSVIYSTPNISAPIGGRTSPLFKQALEEKQKILKIRRKEKPLDAQVKLLGRLFTKLQRLKPPMIRVPADEDEDVYSNKEPGGWNSDDDDGWKKVAKTKVDSPIMAVSIQTFSAPEVDSSDPDVVESMAEFGTHDVEFAETDEIVNLMDTLMHHGSTRMDLRDLGSNPDEINENMLNWVRKHLQVTREANKQAHARGEEIANNQFKQYQTFVTPPFGSNGWGPGEPMPVDPKKARASIPNTMTQNAISMRG